MKTAKDPTRYIRRHRWYRSDADALIRNIQATVWPLGWHVALGGGVLNHGYSNNDLDLYLLPIYNRPECASEIAVLTKVASKFFDSQHPLSEPVTSFDTTHECFKYSVRLYADQKPVEIFVVRR